MKNLTILLITILCLVLSCQNASDKIQNNNTDTKEQITPSSDIKKEENTHPNRKLNFGEKFLCRNFFVQTAEILKIYYT